MNNKKQKLTFVQGLKAQFSTKSLVLIPIAVGINLIGGTLASTLKLPLFLDMIGTILSAALAGPWVAALVGFLTNIFQSNLCAILTCKHCGRSDYRLYD